MKIVLIYLPHPYLKQPDAQAPLGLLYIASSLKYFKNLQVELKNYSSFTEDEAIKDLPKADLYGITVTSLELLQANRFAKKIKEKYIGSKILLGGPGTYTNKFVDFNIIDSILKGEGELTIHEIVSDCMKNSLQKMYHGRQIDYLDSIDFPDRSLLGNNQGGNIFAYNKTYKGNQSTIVLTSRGCPYKCSFCSSSKFNQKVRYRSVSNVVEEIKEIKEKYNIHQIRFSDDMFLANRKRVLSLCKELEKLDIVWRISTRVKPFDLEIAKVMKDSGCVEISFGIESFDNNVLKVLKKGTTCLDNVKALEIAYQANINSRILFMIRTPGQTSRTISENIFWIKRVPYTIIACTTFVPIPGSDIWENPNDYNIEILNKNLDDYNFYFFGKNGENELKDIIKIKDRSLDALNRETLEFKEFLKLTRKLNKG